MTKDLDRALSFLGPLERRIMRAVWLAELPSPFVVRDALRVAPELAYTTMMTTLNRLATKGLLRAERVAHSRALHYRSGGTPTDCLVQFSREQARRLRKSFGDRALAAFAAELDELTPEELERLRRLADQ